MADASKYVPAVKLQMSKLPWKSEALNKIKVTSLYRSLRVTDDNFVWVSGFSFSAEFLRKSKELMRNSRPESEIKMWCQPICVDLDEEGQQAIDQHIADWSTSD